MGPEWFALPPLSRCLTDPDTQRGPSPPCGTRNLFSTIGAWRWFDLPASFLIY
jgi:hypothetical protein